MNFIQQVYKGDNKVWMFLLTAFLISGIFIANLIYFVYLLYTGENIDFIGLQNSLMELIPSKNFWLAVNLLPFAFLLGLLFLLVKHLHQRSILSLSTSRARMDWGRVAFSFSVICIFTLVTFAIGYAADSSNIVVQFNPINFIILFVISILLFPLQIGLEEYFFRGYLMQHIGAFSKNRWMPLIITSILFGVLHGANPEVTEMGLIVMIFYIGTGLLLGIMTLMDEGLELALGFHLGNNLLAALLITSDWSALQTDAIFRYTGEETSGSIAEIVLPVFVVYPIILLILSKKYKWKNWKEKLTGTVVEPLEDDYKILE